ncbi:hypothetical protein Hanom_Chr07g00583181 [Helianthus anomalus]
MSKSTSLFVLPNKRKKNRISSNTILFCRWIAIVPKHKTRQLKNKNKNYGKIV